MKGRKILLIALLLILLGVSIATYVYVLSISRANKMETAATSALALYKPAPALVTGPTISITPEFIQQGEPALITAEGLTSTSSIKSFTFNNRRLVMFIYQNQVTALLGVDLRTVPGTFPLVLILNDGREIKEDLVIKERTVIKEPFDIPEKLGGNTPESERELISTLAQEAKIINALPTSKEKLWTENFESPLSDTIDVTDAYGYVRITGKSMIPHKGVDLRASVGTPVYAMNRGVVRFANYLRNYGSTVVIDHGLGLQTVYMHLSTIVVTEDQMVEKGELLGASGSTGYALEPHLHLSVRIWDISVDPMRFLELLGS